MITVIDAMSTQEIIQMGVVGFILLGCMGVLMLMVYVMITHRERK